MKYTGFKLVFILFFTNIFLYWGTIIKKTAWWMQCLDFITLLEKKSSVWEWKEIPLIKCLKVKIYRSFITKL